MATAGVNVGGGARSIVDPPAAVYDGAGSTLWSGWIGFASVMLIMIGCFHAIAGFVGIFKDGYYVAPKSDLLVTVDYTAWGWAHLIFGIVAVLVAVGMMAGKMWARIFGVVFAVLSATANLAFLNAQPVWSTLLIAFDVILIWALTVHGGELKEYA